MNAQVSQTNVAKENTAGGQVYRPYIIADDREREIIAPPPPYLGILIA